MHLAKLNFKVNLCLEKILFKERKIIMKRKKVALLIVTIAMAFGMIGCTAEKQYNIGNGKEVEENAGNNYSKIYKVTQQKGKDNLKVTVTNPLKAKFNLTFGSTQEYEFIVFKSGKEVYRYSKDKAFGEMIVKKEIGANEKLEYNIDLNSTGLKTGEYSYEFYLVANELKDLPHKKGTLTIGKVKSNNPNDNQGIAYFPLKYEVKDLDSKKLVVEVKNQNEKPVKLTYTSGQKFDAKFYKEGKLIYTWSEDKKFTMAICEKTLMQAESEIYELGLDGIPLEKGNYDYEFYSTAKELTNTPHLKGKITIK